MSSDHLDANPAQVPSPAADRGPWAGMEAGESARDLDRATLLASVEELAKSIAHDVNQPLGAVLMTARACQRGLASGSLSADQVRDGLDRIVADLRRIGEILAHFRAATRQPSALRLTTDINAVIRRALADVAPDLAR